MQPKMNLLRVPLINLSTCIFYRPPMVVFSICWAAFCVVTFGLSLYVKHSSSPIRNPDILSWYDVAVHWSRLEFCLEPPGESRAPPINRSEMESVSVAFGFDAESSAVWKKVNLLTGSLDASALGLRAADSRADLSFTLSLMEPLKQVCLTVYHPASVRMPGNASGCDPLKYNHLPQSGQAFVVPHGETPTCAPERRFKMSVSQDPRKVEFLSQEDRALIGMHLMATSWCLLLVLALILLVNACYGTAGGPARAKASKMHVDLEDDKEPLNP